MHNHSGPSAQPRSSPFLFLLRKRKKRNMSQTDRPTACRATLQLSIRARTTSYCPSEQKNVCAVGGGGELVGTQQHHNSDTFLLKRTTKTHSCIFLSPILPFASCISQQLVLPLFQIISCFSFSRCINFAMPLDIHMSRCIVKLMYLKKTKQLKIWDGGNNSLYICI